MATTIGEMNVSPDNGIGGSEDRDSGFLIGLVSGCGFPVYKSLVRMSRE
jgi:hypothetical protein